MSCKLQYLLFSSWILPNKSLLSPALACVTPRPQLSCSHSLWPGLTPLGYESSLVQVFLAILISIMFHGWTCSPNIQSSMTVFDYLSRSLLICYCLAHPARENMASMFMVQFNHPEHKFISFFNWDLLPLASALIIGCKKYNKNNLKYLFSIWIY